MSDFINRLRRLPRFGGVSGGRSADRPTDLPLDHRLTFCPHPDEKWTFEEERRICINDVDVAEVLGEGANDVRLLCGLSQGLSEYRQHVWGKGGRDQAKFNAVVFALQDTILGRLGSIYDGVTCGVKFECDGRDFWVNNVNVRSVLALYWLKPTDKARRYLAGLRDKLGLILSRRQSSTRYDGIHEQARGFFDEITLALEHIPSDAPYRLGDGSRCV